MLIKHQKRANIASSRPRLRRVLAAGKRALGRACWQRGFPHSRRGGLCLALGGASRKKGRGRCQVVPGQVEPFKNEAQGAEV